MLWRLRPSDTDIELHAHTIKMCKQLEVETEACDKADLYNPHSFYTLRHLHCLQRRIHDVCVVIFSLSDVPIAVVPVPSILGMGPGFGMWDINSWCNSFKKVRQAYDNSSKRWSLGLKTEACSSPVTRSAWMSIVAYRKPVNITGLRVGFWRQMRFRNASEHFIMHDESPWSFRIAAIASFDICYFLLLWHMFVCLAFFVCTDFNPAAQNPNSIWFN